MLPDDRKCILLADEILKSEFQYKQKDDIIYGVEDFGDGRTKESANYALLFVQRGIKRKWKQQISFFQQNCCMIDSCVKFVLKVNLKYNLYWQHHHYWRWCLLVSHS